MSIKRVTDRHDGPLTESELLAQARRGSASAIGALYESHGANLLRLGVRITGSQSDAEDLLHDLFVGLPELLSRYEHRSKLDAWLRAVMARMAIAKLRQGTRRERLASSNVEHGHHMPDDPWSAVDLDRAIAQLPETTRAVFVLRQIEGYSHDEIGGLLDITSGASRVRYLRALRQLRAFLEPQS
jgi:RNA polymerase sigma factor (sigma-70 family)